MGEIGETLVQAGVAFLSTTIDDFIVILYFMSRLEKKYHVAHKTTTAEAEEIKRKKTMAYIEIFLGALLGFTIIALLSMLGLIFRFILDDGLIGLLGIIPIIIGILKIWDNADEAGYCDGIKDNFVYYCGCCTLCSCCFPEREKDEEEEEEKEEDDEEACKGGSGQIIQNR